MCTGFETPDKHPDSWQALRLGRWLERCPCLYVAGLNPFRVINLLGGCTSASGVGGYRYRAEDPACLPLLLVNRPSRSALYRSSCGKEVPFFWAQVVSPERCSKLPSHLVTQEGLSSRLYCLYCCTGVLSPPNTVFILTICKPALIIFAYRQVLLPTS